jgi:hypothetical protein
MNLARRAWWRCARRFAAFKARSSLAAGTAAPADRRPSWAIVTSG